MSNPESSPSYEPLKPRDSIEKLDRPPAL